MGMTSGNNGYMTCRCIGDDLYDFFHISHVMRNPNYAICEQQMRRSACASAQSDQCLCYSLPR